MEGQNDEKKYDQEPVSEEEKLRRDIHNFSISVDQMMAGTLQQQSVKVMSAPLVMKLTGADILPVYIDRSVLHKILMGKHKEEMSPDLVKQIPRQLTDPLMILKSFDKQGKEIPNEQIFMIDLKDRNGSTIMVPLLLNVKNRHFEIHKIKSAYGRTFQTTSTPNNRWYIDKMSEKNLLYINKKRIIAWMQNLRDNSLGDNERRNLFGAHTGSQRHSMNTISSILNIPTEDDLVKLKHEVILSRKEIKFFIPEDLSPFCRQRLQRRLDKIFQTNPPAPKTLEQKYKILVKEALLRNQQTPYTEIDQAAVQKFLSEGYQPFRIKDVIFTYSPQIPLEIKPSEYQKQLFTRAKKNQALEKRKGREIE